MKASEYLIYKLSDQMKASTKIDADLFKQKKVKRGLRNEDGTGVLVGLTNIGNVVGYERLEDGSLKPIEGRLYFRGYEISDIVSASRRWHICCFRDNFRTMRNLRPSTILWWRICLWKRIPFCTSSNWRDTI